MLAALLAIGPLYDELGFEILRKRNEKTPSRSVGFFFLLFADIPLLIMIDGVQIFIWRQ